MSSIIRRPFREPRSRCHPRQPCRRRPRRVGLVATRARLAVVIAAAALTLGACRPAGPPLPPPPAPEAEADAAWSEEGHASWYGEAFQGRPTASGEPFDMEALTAAHPTLPFGTRVQVQNLDNGRDVTVRINDRGPFVDGRIIDVSRRAARELGMIDAGVAPVRLTLVEEP